MRNLPAAIRVADIPRFSDLVLDLGGCIGPMAVHVTFIIDLRRVSVVTAIMGDCMSPGEAPWDSSRDVALR